MKSYQKTNHKTVKLFLYYFKLPSDRTDAIAKNPKSINKEPDK